MTDTTNAELEDRFDRAGIPRHHLYPFWYRWIHWLGFPIRPPVTYSFLEHVIASGTYVLLVMATFGGWFWWQYGTSASLLARLAVFLVCMNSVWLWLRYKRIRRQIGW